MSSIRQSPAAALSWAIEADPGPEVIAALAGIDPAALGEGDRVRLVGAIARQGAWLEALGLRALAAAAGPDPARALQPSSDIDALERDSGEVLIQDEIRAALRVAGITAKRRIEVARALAERLPGTLAALAAGQISPVHAVCICEETADLDDAKAGRAEVQVLPDAATQTPGQTRRATARVAARLAPPTPVQVIEAEYARRGMSMRAVSAVMAEILLTLPAPDAAEIWNAATAVALGDDRCDDLRTLEHKRADAVAAMARAALDDPGLPVHQGRKRLETQLVIDLPTLLGLAEHPGELRGYGPIPAPLARELAADSNWRRLVTDPADGHLLDYGRTTYQPPARLREYVIARDQTCRFPACAQPAWLCDLDHAVPFDQDGATSAANLGALCRRHHNLKSHGHWTITESAADGSCTWTSPAGLTYQHHPPAHSPPANQPADAQPGVLKPAESPPTPVERRLADHVWYSAA